MGALTQKNLVGAWDVEQAMLLRALLMVGEIPRFLGPVWITRIQEVVLLAQPHCCGTRISRAGPWDSLVMALDRPELCGHLGMQVGCVRASSWQMCASSSETDMHAGLKPKPCSTNTNGALEKLRAHGSWLPWRGRG